MCVVADDPLLRSGTVTQLGSLGLLVVCEEEITDGTVALLVSDTFDDDLEARLGAIRARAPVASVLVQVALDGSPLCPRAPRRRARDRVAPRRVAPHAAHRALLGRPRRRKPPARPDRPAARPPAARTARAIGAGSGSTRRELDVLRLVADGCDTHEIAVRLAYSERAIKATLHDVTTRLGLRNRSHAVAFLIRRGVL